MAVGVKPVGGTRGLAENRSPLFVQKIAAMRDVETTPVCLSVGFRTGKLTRTDAKKFESSV